MKEDITTTPAALRSSDLECDGLEMGVREQLRGFIEALLEEELEQALGRGRYQRGSATKGWRNGHRERQITGTFGQQTVEVPRGRVKEADGSTKEWRSKSLRRYQRLTRKAEALIAQVYLAGTNTRRVRRALEGLFAGAVGKDVVSRAWRKARTDWEAWNARDLSGEDLAWLLLDGTVVKTRQDRKATNISVLVAVGVRRDGQKILLGIKDMGGESTEAWRAFLDDFDARGLKAPDLAIIDGGKGLHAALTALWPQTKVQRCTVHKHRNLIAHAPTRDHEDLTEDYRDMIYAKTPEEVSKKRKAFRDKWRLKCPAVVDSLDEAGDELFTFLSLPPAQWKAARTTNAIERLHEEFKRRIKTQTVLPDAKTAPMLFWALLAAGEIVMRRVDGWEQKSPALSKNPVDLAA